MNKIEVMNEVLPLNMVGKTFDGINDIEQEVERRLLTHGIHLMDLTNQVREYKAEPEKFNGKWLESKPFYANGEKLILVVECKVTKDGKLYVVFVSLS